MTRPISPHMTIYQPQLTWLMSIAHRITGAGTAVGLYSGLIGYGLAGPRGGQENAQLLVDMRRAIREAPVPLVAMGKAVVSGPLAYHYLNGMRHLMWDLGVGLSLRGVYASGWAVNALTLLTAGYFTLLV